MKKQFRDFESARKFAKSLGLKGAKEWFVYCKSNKPDDIPRNPQRDYKDWVGWGDFLDTGNTYKKEFKDFESARKFAKSLGLKGAKEWKEYCVSGNKPDDIPYNVQGYYQKEWKTWGDFLGTGTIATYNKQYRSFETSREFVRSLGLKNVDEWREYCKSGEKPDDMTSSPQKVYKNKGWEGWGDWTGTGNTYKKEFKDFESARLFVRSLGLGSGVKWDEYCKSGEKSHDLPMHPDQYYKNKGWKTWGHFLGTGSIASQLKQYRSFKEAREFVRTLGLKGVKEWYDYCKSGEKPDDIPTAPWNVYKEWKKK
jgi:hypothetical protein